MIIEYVNKALERSTYRQLEDRTWFAEIPGFEGVWANAGTVEACRRELVEVLEEWLVFKLRDHDAIPVLDGIQLRITEERLA